MLETRRMLETRKTEDTEKLEDMLVLKTCYAEDIRNTVDTRDAEDY